MKVLKLKGLIFCYVLIVYYRCYCMNSSALNINKSRNEMFGSRTLKKCGLQRKNLALQTTLQTTNLSTLPQTFKKRSSILKHKNSTTVRDKRTVSIPPLTYYHSKFRMNLIRKDPKKDSTTKNERQGQRRKFLQMVQSLPMEHRYKFRERRKFLQMVQSLPIEHRYKFGIPPKDCRNDMCNITGKIVLNDTLILIAITVCFNLI